MNPSTHPDLYTTIMLGTETSPGTCTITGHDRNKNWDVKPAKGSTGANSTLNGDPIGEFQVSFYLATAEQQTEWESFRKHIDSLTSGPTPIALPIYHPDLAENGFTEVSNASIGGRVWDSKGGCTVLVKFIEYKPPKPKPARSAQSRERVGTTTVEAPDPNAAAKAELAELLAEARKP